MDAVTESKVLVIYTGGTIGMLNQFGGTRGGQSQGLAPEPFFLTETLRSQSRFHDPFEDSLFSHSGSVEGFRRWNTSSATKSVSGKTFPIREQDNSPSNASVSTALQMSSVRSSRPILAQLMHQQASDPFQTNTRVTEAAYKYPDISHPSPYYEAKLPTLVTPRTQSPSG